MKKIIVWFMMLALLETAAIFATAAPSRSTAVTNLQVIKARPEDSTINYNGVKIFIPAGQSVMLGQRPDGTILVRGLNLNGIKVGGSSISSTGLVIVAVHPKTQIITLVNGPQLEVVSNGNKAVLAQGDSTLFPIRSSAASTNDTQAVASVVPSFVADTEISNIVSEQATQDVTETEETLSPSAPR